MNKMLIRMTTRMVTGFPISYIESVQFMTLNSFKNDCTTFKKKVFIWTCIVIFAVHRDKHIRVNPAQMIWSDRRFDNRRITTTSLKDRFCENHELIRCTSLNFCLDFANLDEQAAQLMYKKSTLNCFKQKRSMSKYDECIDKYTLRGTNRKELIDPDESKVTSFFWMKTESSE